MAGDAYALGVIYADRERHATASALFTLADFANAELEDRTRGVKSLETTYWTSPVQFDPTSPAEHNKDDLGTVIARVIALVDSDRGSVGYVWAKIASHLAKERDRLRGEASFSERIGSEPGGHALDSSTQQAPRGRRLRFRRASR